MNDIFAKLEAARIRALNNGVPVRRQDGTLYALLADCLDLVETVDRDGLDAELRAALRKHGPNRAGRRYIETGSDNFILVCRFVLEGVDNRNSIYRYAASLREAGKAQIRSSELAGWLAKNGGINALFKARPVTARTTRTKTLHLVAAVEVPKDRAFTITLRRTSTGFFDVVAA